MKTAIFAWMVVVCTGSMGVLYLVLESEIRRVEQRWAECSPSAPNMIAFIVIGIHGALSIIVHAALNPYHVFYN